MKKLFFTFVLCLTCSLLFSANPLKLKGTYLSTDYGTESIYSLIRVTYTFVNDSLYIDAYPTGCNISSMSLKKKSKNSYKASETLYDEDTSNIVQKKEYNLSFFPCIWDENSIAVFKDSVVVDIIKLVEK